MGFTRIVVIYMFNFKNYKIQMWGFIIVSPNPQNLPKLFIDQVNIIN